MFRRSKLLVALSLASLVCFVGVTGGARAADAARFWDLGPDQLRELIASPQVMVTRTESGFEAYCRCPVVLRPHEIPAAMRDAIVAVEDKRYFDHGGVDLITLVAVLKGGLSRGGSTIPMQLLKNLVFHDLQHRDVLTRIERKGAELWHAGSFDGAVGKDHLLAAYLNQVEFGGRDIVGLYRAARHYFRKEPKDLNLYEAAMLAGMVQAPARLNPLREATRERAHERARLVLKLMAEQGRITEDERRRAIRRGIRPGMLPEFKINPQAFAEWIVQTSGEKHVRVGETVRFFATLDPRLQYAAEQHLRALVAAGAVPPEHEAAVVAMDDSGRVQAMVGSVDWAKSQFNHAAKAQVQPGSTAKLPLVLAACEAGRQPSSPVVDLPVRPGWPANGAVGYRGETSLKEAIASSRNAAAVRLAQELGPKAVAEVGRKLGLDPGPVPDPGLVLGTFSTSPLKVTSAYAAVANGGFSVSPTGWLAAVDGRGEVRALAFERPRERVVSRRCADQAKQVLREVVLSGTGRAAALPRNPAYGKTGTTSGNVDAWFVGWSEGRVVGVWMGRRRDAAVAAALAGSGPPANLFRRIQETAIALDGRRRPAAAAAQAADKARTPEVRRAPAKEPGPPDARTSQVPLPPARPKDAGSGTT